MPNPWDDGPADTTRNRFIGGVLVIVATVLIYLALASKDRNDHTPPTQVPTSTVSR